MCGIAGAFTPAIRAAGALLAHRGPDAEGTVTQGLLTLVHRRLAVLDPDPRSDQPFTYGAVTLAYNGECWNYRELRAELEREGCRFRTSGDTEVVAAALSRWGEAALPRLNGMFALAWTQDGGETVRVARDRFGEVPVYVGYRADRGAAFASERKVLRVLGWRGQVPVGPGEVWTLSPGTAPTRRRYHEQSARPGRIDRGAAARHLGELLAASCGERAISDVKVSTLLSGGIDSAAVALLLKDHVPGLVAYTAVMDPRSPDLKAAREVARFLSLTLVEVPVSRPTPADLSEVVRVIEMPSKAQVEIGWACMALARAMQVDRVKVTFSGEGSDELWASYGFSYHALKTKDWHAYRRDLFLGQAERNFARCNKVFMAYGIECRLPFLNPNLVSFALSLPREAVQDGSARPKAVLQDAFQGLLPERVTRRPKAAFQDALGLKAAIAATLPRPERFYRAEHARFYA
jgi:asparagine synthase (glutamine-hydrolysing)